MKKEKAILLDKILLKFKGNATVTWNELRTGIWNDIHDYDHCENNINFLVGEGMLKRGKEGAVHNLSMTDKGFATMTDISNLGYVKKFKNERRDNLIRYISFTVTILSFLILLYKLGGSQR